MDPNRTEKLVWRGIPFWLQIHGDGQLDLMAESPMGTPYYVLTFSAEGVCRVQCVGTTGLPVDEQGRIQLNDN